MSCPSMYNVSIVKLPECLIWMQFNDSLWLINLHNMTFLEDICRKSDMIAEQLCYSPRLATLTNNVWHEKKIAKLNHRFFLVKLKITWEIVSFEWFFLSKQTLLCIKYCIRWWFINALNIAVEQWNFSKMINVTLNAFRIVLTHIS